MTHHHKHLANIWLNGGASPTLLNFPCACRNGLLRCTIFFRIRQADGKAFFEGFGFVRFPVFFKQVGNLAFFRRAVELIYDGSQLIKIFEGCRDSIFVQCFDFQGAFEAGGVVVLSLNDKVVINAAHFAARQLFVFGKERFYFIAGVIFKGCAVFRGVFFLIDAIEFLYDLFGGFCCFGVFGEGCAGGQQ